jgi:hypothetical protein
VCWNWYGKCGGYKANKQERAMSYHEFLEAKSQIGHNSGFEPVWMPEFLFPFQRHLVEWAIRKGRAAIFADCGMGKTPMQLVWAENVVRRTNKPVMIATPLAVGAQTEAEANKFGVHARRTRDGRMDGGACILITNYEQLHKYDANQFGGMVCDESSAIKDFKSERKKVVTEFMRRLPYRLLCTATAAPNDFWELGTSSEALGYLGFRDMITTFFKQETQKDYLGWGRTKYRFRGHAEQPFWQWVCSWARALRMPSDLGFDDDGFVLPPLSEPVVVVQSAKPRPGMLFTLPARDMHEERAERRNTIEERCEVAAANASAHDGATVLWCELNPEGDRVASMLSDCVQVAGSMSDEAKEEALLAFSSGQVRRLVTKPKIGAWGLNWQHCHNVVCFPSHSYEQYYQLVRRCYRFGQLKSVTVTRIVCEGEERIIANVDRKRQQANRMFDHLVEFMNEARQLESEDFFPEKVEVPEWLVTR